MSKATHDFASTIIEGQLLPKGENETLEDRYKRYWKDSHNSGVNDWKLMRLMFQEQFGELRPQHEDMWELILITEDRIEKLKKLNAALIEGFEGHFGPDFWESPLGKLVKADGESNG